jgi:hypothetical protein
MIERSWPNFAEIAISPDKAFWVRNRPRNGMPCAEPLLRLSNGTAHSTCVRQQKALKPTVRQLTKRAFGTIYLTLNTVNGKKIPHLTNSDTPYRLSNQIPFYRHGQWAGNYLVWTPKVLGHG